jgi:hypothetical protein
LAEVDASLLRSAHAGFIDLVKTALEQGASVAAADPRDGLTALHIAVGTNNLPMARLLIEEWKAPFGPDSFGRWPSVVAAECCVSEELCDYIVEQEAAALAASK